jgi:hypothetical protein
VDSLIQFLLSPFKALINLFKPKETNTSVGRKRNYSPYKKITTPRQNIDAATPAKASAPVKAVAPPVAAAATSAAPVAPPAPKVVDIVSVCLQLITTYS